MKFYQVNKLIVNDRARTSDFIKEIRDLDDRLISYVYMGRLPIHPDSKYRQEWIAYSENGSVRYPMYELVI